MYYDLKRDVMLVEYYFTIENTEIVHVDWYISDMYYSYFSSLML